MSSKDFKKKTIAIVYDFDGTLSPGSMQNHHLLPSLGGDSASFWQSVKTLKAEQKSVEILTYMHILMQQMNAQNIRDSFLPECGAKVPLFRGVNDWFPEIDKLVKELSKDRISVRHYILSSGLAEMLAGNPVSKFATKVFASSFMWKDGVPMGVARAITDASKPQYIFRINKGKENYSEDINDHMEEEDRPIPFSHIIFIGDGETDIPCMTVARRNGGHAIAVYDPEVPSNVEKCKQMYNAKRVNFYAPADYRKDKPLWARTEIILKKIIADIRLEWADHLFRTRVVDPTNSQS